MGKFKFLIVFILLFMTSCSNNTDRDKASEYGVLIEEQQNKIYLLEEELQQVKTEYDLVKNKLVDYSADLQLYDNNSRKIMQLISKGKYEELKKDYDVEFEVKDGYIYFDGLTNAPFPSNLAGLPMFIAFYNIQPENTEIGYYIDDGDERYLVSFLYGKDRKFRYIFLGDT